MSINPEHQTIMDQVLAQLENADWKAIEQHPGLYETLQHFPHMLAAFPDLTHTFERGFSQGEMFAYVLTVSGTHQGEFMGIAPTGRRVNFQLVGMEQIVDGKIVHHNVQPDMLGLLMQIGAVISAPQGQQL
jgi:predicted ester cyclase